MKYITIVGVEPEKPRKTQIFEVRTGNGWLTLGQVKWFSRWRKYSFFPADGTVFEQQCLRDIATFCEAMTSQHWADKAREKFHVVR